jgi:hypothetical protein
MVLAVSIWDIGLWIAISSVMMLLASEVLSPYYGRTNILIKQKTMRRLGLGFFIAFFLITFMRITSSSPPSL